MLVNIVLLSVFISAALNSREKRRNKFLYPQKTFCFYMLTGAIPSLSLLGYLRMVDEMSINHLKEEQIHGYHYYAFNAEDKNNNAASTTPSFLGLHIGTPLSSCL